MKKFLSLLGLLICAFTLTGATPPSTLTPIQVPIIMYHSLAGSTGSSTSISGEAFAADLQYLRDHGYETVTLQQLADFVHHSIPLPPQPIVLTFDDGYWNNYAIGLPLAQQYNTPIVVSIIGKDTEIWSDIPSENLRHGHVTWTQIQEMADSNLVEIANHTWDLHKNEHSRKGATMRGGESLEQYRDVLRTDLGRLQDELTTRCGITPISFAFPFGATCPEATEILHEMGFLVSLSCYDGINTLTVGDPSCLYNMHRYDRTSTRSVEEILTSI